MMTGRVTAQREIAPTVSLADPSSAPVDAIVDTGFTGELSLPGDLLHTLGVSPSGTRTGELADGSLVVMNVYDIRILWRGRPRDVTVVEADSTPLVGMELLWDSRVAFDARNQGPMVIDELTPGSTP